MGLTSQLFTLNGKPPSHKVKPFSENDQIGIAVLTSRVAPSISSA